VSTSVNWGLRPVTVAQSEIPNEKLQGRTQYVVFDGENGGFAIIFQNLQKTRRFIRPVLDDLR
jgi:hypothetical protein